jgi:hypothetical protein
MMTRTMIVAAMVAAALLGGCAASQDVNPAGMGFDVQGSDARAIEIADEVMVAMGGRAAWDDTRYISFVFFGSRRHVWDRRTGNIRIEGTDRQSGEPYRILMNVHDETGQAWQNEQPVEGDALDEMLSGGRSAWINDTYWLVMPYKLKDSGVTLTHVGSKMTEAGADAEVLELRFEGVGDTPQNKYHVYVGTESGVVEQWDFFRDAADEESAFSTPWVGWTQHGAILLSGDRGELRGNRIQLTEIAVHDALPGSVFTSPEPTTLFTESGE